MVLIMLVINTCVCRGDLISANNVAITRPSKYKIIYVSNGTVFWKELSKLNPTNKVSSNQIDDASGSIEISKLFHDKYRLLYSSVPTDLILRS